MRAITIALGIVCFILFPQSAIFAQTNTGIIKGKIATADGEPAAAVGIRLKDTRRQTLSDEGGGFIFRNLKPGTYEMEVFLFDHDKYTRSVTVTAGETAVVDVRMTMSQKTLREVVIAGDRNKFARKESEYVSRMPLKNLENPQVYTVVPAELMREQVTLDYKDAIKNVAGVNSTETVGNGRTSAIIRGFRTGSFIRNGMVANQLITVDPANLERVEVIKGPSGTLFGSGAVSYGGVVNRITKKPFETFKTELGFTAGSFGLNRITADINAPLNEDRSVLLRVNMGRHAMQSFQETGFKQNYFLAAALTYKVNEKLTFLFDLELFRNHGTSAVAYINPDAGVKDFRQMEKFYYKTFTSNDLTSTYPGYNVYAQMNYKLNNSWHTTTLFSTGGVNARQQLQFTGTIIAGGDSLTRRIQKYSHNYNSIQVQQNINGEFKTGAVRHRVLIGADYLADITQPTYTMAFMFDTIGLKNPVMPYILGEKIDQRLAQTALASHFQSQTDRFGIYAADVINFTDRLLLMLSLRWDKVDNKGTYSFITGKTTGNYSKSSLSPKLGVVYQVMKEQLSVFANYMNGFSYTGTLDKQGNIFKPEQANQFEGGVKADLFNGKLMATVSYYDITVSDKLRTDPADIAFQVQDGTQKSKGLEVELISNPLPGLNILGGYGFNESKFTKANADIQGKRPARSGGQHIGNAWISYKLPAGKAKGLGIGGGVFYNSETVFNDANTLFFPAYALVNGTVFYDRPGYRIGVKLDNITNTKYWGPWGEPQPPRNYAVNLIVKF